MWNPSDCYIKSIILQRTQDGNKDGVFHESQLIFTVNDLTSSLNNKSHTDMVIMDFSKDFDTVPHNQLLLKLERSGIRGNLLTWIANFLKCRIQRVVVGGKHLASTDVGSGVPEGMVLGPLSFLAYINNLPQNLNSEVRWLRRVSPNSQRPWAYPPSRWP